MNDVVARGQSTRVVEDVGMKSTPLHGVHDAAKRGLGARATSKMGGELIHLVERMTPERRKLVRRFLQHVERK
jgi:hypothetical protein